MELSIFLAKLIGLALLIIGIAILGKTKNFQDSVRDCSKNHAIMTLISFMPLIAGLAIVISHNSWDKDWTIVVTLVGWLILLIGVIRLFFHKDIMMKMAILAKNKNMFITIGIVLIIIGGYLAGKGFYGSKFL